MAKFLRIFAPKSSPVSAPVPKSSKPLQHDVDVTDGLRVGAEAHPIGRIRAISLDHSDELFAGNPVVLTLDKRHLLIIHASIHGVERNEYVSARVVNGKSPYGVVLVKRGDIRVTFAGQDCLYVGNRIRRNIREAPSRSPGKGPLCWIAELLGDRRRTQF